MMEGGFLLEMISGGNEARLGSVYVTYLDSISFVADGKEERRKVFFDATLPCW